jgi:DNA-binding GntR family transcriptional regulator
MTAGQTPSSTPAEQLADRAYFGLRDRIVDLRLPPGSTLREDELMREMGIGRTPLREAVKRLALEHLVEVRPRRGTMVTDVHAEDIARFAEVRAELEPHAARLAAERMPDELRAQAALLTAEVEVAEGQDAEALMRLDERIHRLAWRAAGNPYLEATLEGYWALSLRVWHLVLDRVPSLPGAVHEREALLDALLSGDGGRAEAVMREHVVAFERHVLEAIES